MSDYMYMYMYMYMYTCEHLQHLYVYSIYSNKKYLQVHVITTELVQVVHVKQRSHLHVNIKLAVIYISHSPFPIPGDTEGVDLTLVYDHLAFAEYSLGNMLRALQYTKDLLQNGNELCM